MKTNSKVNMRKNIFLCASTIILMLIFAEIGARIWARLKGPSPKKLENTRYNYCPYLPYVAAPYYKNEKKNIYHNSRGFRNSYEFEIPKPDDVYRIVCLGGSTTYSDNDNAQNEQIWTGRLEYYLSKNSSNDMRYEVINASGHNYTAYMNLIDYLTRVRDLQVDMIIIYEGINEIYFNGYEDSSFAHYNVFKQTSFDAFNKKIDYYNSNYLLKKSEFLRRLYIRWHFKSKSLNSMSTKSSHYNSAKNIEKMKKDSLLTFRKALEGFIAISKVDNAKLVFLSQAYHYRKLEQSLYFFNKLFNEDNIKDYTYETKRVAKLMETIAIKNDIPFSDMNLILEEQEKYFQKNPLDAVHFSKQGEDYFALQVYKFIAQKILDK